VGLQKKDSGRTGLTPENIVQKLCVPLLTHASNDVRDAAIQLVAVLHDYAPPTLIKKLLADVKPVTMDAIDEAIKQRQEGGAGGGAVGGGKGGEAEMASSSIQVEKGGNHPVLEAARQAKAQEAKAAPARGGGGSGAAAATGPAASAASGNNTSATEDKTQARQQQAKQEREAQEREAATCQFCGKYDKRFTDAVLDAHYAKSCPFLMPCPLCEQITEIPTLQHHLITECNRATAVKQCPTCREAVPVAEFDDHVAAASCIPHSTQYQVCPLCHAKLPPKDQAWDDHLLKAPGCAMNPRRFDGGAGAEFK
jgi:centrosomal protein CEP104